MKKFTTILFIICLSLKAFSIPPLPKKIVKFEELYVRDTTILKLIAAHAGIGSVNISGTPVVNQFAVWTNSNTLIGYDGLKFDNSTLKLTIGTGIYNYSEYNDIAQKILVGGVQLMNISPNLGSSYTPYLFKTARSHKSIPAFELKDSNFVLIEAYYDSITLKKNTKIIGNLIITGTAIANGVTLGSGGSGVTPTDGIYHWNSSTNKYEPHSVSQAFASFYRLKSAPTNHHNDSLSWDGLFKAWTNINNVSTIMGTASGSGAIGVKGVNPTGRGVVGETTTFRGVDGIATSGTGVNGYVSSGGISLRGESADNTGKTFSSIFSGVENARIVKDTMTLICKLRVKDSIFGNFPISTKVRWCGVSRAGALYADSTSTADFALKMKLPGFNKFYNDRQNGELGWFYSNGKKSYGIKDLTPGQQIGALMAGIEIQTRYIHRQNIQIRILESLFLLILGFGIFLGLKILSLYKKKVL